MNIKSVKLVIWDLDETFWRGTLSEESVQPIDDNIEIVKCLVDRGIMNSIVSKNDFNRAIDVLKKWEMDKYFVFPQISWNPKGEKVKNLLSIMKLRAENVVFVDDNISNLEEVKFYNPGIEAVIASEFTKSVLNESAFKGKDDKKHSRLAQYKILEKRTEEEAKYSSNEEFLRMSNIRINICEDCINEIDRIAELIERTNQLNYTKVRSSKEELNGLINDDSVECRYITAKDNFGEYGIVGFYALRDNILEHFLFSCRVLGFGVERYIYQKLNRPYISVVGEVTTPLDEGGCVDWITEGDSNECSTISEETKKDTQKRILMVSGCDLEQACAYLKGSFRLEQEFATVIDGKEIRTSDSSQLVNSLILDKATKEELCANIPFFDKSVTFESKMFSDDYGVVIYSVVDDYIRGMYKHNTKDYYIGCGGFHDQDLYLTRYTDEELKYFKENFTFVGKESSDIFEKNLETIISNISKDTKIILINGIDLDVSDWIDKVFIERNREMNKVVDDIVARFDNVFLVDMRKIVTDREKLIKKDNRHFDRSTYHAMAIEIAQLCESGSADKNLAVKSRLLVDGKDFIKRKLNGLQRRLGKNR